MQAELAGHAGIHAKAVTYWERMGAVSQRQAHGWAPTRMLAAFMTAGVNVVAEPRPAVFFGTGAI